MNGTKDPVRTDLVKNCVDMETHYKKQHEPWISAYSGVRMALFIGGLSYTVVMTQQKLILRL